MHCSRGNNRVDCLPKYLTNADPVGSGKVVSQSVRAFCAQITLMGHDPKLCLHLRCLPFTGVIGCSSKRMHNPASVSRA